jgi:hypothetical protein
MDMSSQDVSLLGGTSTPPIGMMRSYLQEMIHFQIQMRAIKLKVWHFFMKPQHGKTQ